MNFLSFATEKEKEAFVMVSETAYHASVDAAIEVIRSRKALRFIALAGPTCSGKTTTANLIIKEDISVRQIEALVKEAKKSPAKPKEPKKRDKFFSEVELALVDNLGRKVKIKENGKKGSGILEIEFFDKDDLESLALQLENYGK